MCAPACGGAIVFSSQDLGRACLSADQQVIATLGRFEDLQASGQLERLVRSAVCGQGDDAERGNQ
jgi:hypothetical protein